MKAFYGKQELKNKYVKQLEKHYAANEIRQGHYWDKGKGCAIGCLLTKNTSDFDKLLKEDYYEIDSFHKKIQVLFGFSWKVARLADGLFERLPNVEAIDFSLDWFKAIKINSDLSLVCTKFYEWEDVEASPYMRTTAITNAAKFIELIKAA